MTSIGFEFEVTNVIYSSYLSFDSSSSSLLELGLILKGSAERKFCSKALECFSIKAALLRELEAVGAIVLTCVKESNMCDVSDRSIMRYAITNSRHLFLGSLYSMIGMRSHSQFVTTQNERLNLSLSFL